MKHYLTIILKTAIVVSYITMIVINVGVTWWVSLILERNMNHLGIMILLLCGLYLLTIFLYAALFQTAKLLKCIEINQAFSKQSVASLNIIFRCFAGIFLTCILAGLPFFYYWAQLDDAPGVFLIGLILCGITFIIAVFALLLKLLWQEALNVKSENELTI